MVQEMKPIRATYPDGTPANLFFQPDEKMIEWLVKYANGRMIVDVGCGSGWLLEKLHKAGAKCFGIEPIWSFEMLMAWRNKTKGQVHVLTTPVELCESIIAALKNKALLLFCRPCHSDFTEVGISMLPKGGEALYITLHENLEKYDDLGMFRYNAVPVKHEGCSLENEIVLSIKK